MNTKYVDTSLKSKYGSITSEALTNGESSINAD